MRRYNKYGNECTHLTLTAKAAKEYSGCDYKIREYSDGSYEIWLDNHAEVTGMTAEEVNEFFEALADECSELND